jgi:prepilin-type N-terminal cleavage/methylation domain-containing protein
MGIRRGVRADGGFSLVELMSVVAILGILVAVAVASFWISIERSRRITCLHNQRLMDSAVMQYQLDNNAAFPPDLDDVEPYVKWSGPNYATCASDPSLAFTYDASIGLLECASHPR